MPLLEYEFRSSVGYWIHMAAHRFERAMNAEAMAEGLTFRQVQILAWLAIDGDLAQFELAERMNVEPPSLVGVLERMEKSGLIARETSDEDRRRKIVRPLPKAVPVWNRIVACAERVKMKATDGLSEEQRRQLIALLQIVDGNLSPSHGLGGCAESAGE